MRRDKMLVMPKHEKRLLLLQETDELTAAIKELGQQFPSLLEPLIYERDRVMVCQLRLVTQK